MALKKVLIILYYWPPAGGPGVQRWLKFVKYLPKFGVEPIVYCPENPNYPIIDESLQKEIPSGLTIIKHPINEPYKIANFFSKGSKKISSGIIPKDKKQSPIEKLMLYVRGNYFIPDARKSWIKPSVAFLSEYIKDSKIDTIITTGPPHSLHLIGLELKRNLNLKWVADFRDPWTKIGYHKELKLRKKSQKKHLLLESEVLQNANHIIVTSNHTKQEFEAKTTRPISVITNGYDTHSVSIKCKDTKFTLSHIGSLLSERNPKILWEVLSDLATNNKAFSKAFQLNLVGVVSDDVLATIQKYGLEKFTNIVGYVSHDESIKYQMQSQLLLLIEIDSETNKAIIPGKLFEYLVSETPILAIGPKDSEIEQIIISTNTGTYFNFHERERLKAQILNYFQLFINDNLKVKGIGLQKYSRRVLTEKLATLLFS